MKFFCAGDEDLVRGFRLAGVDGRVVTDAAGAAAALDEAEAMADCGVLIMSAAAADLARARVDALRLGRARPLVVEVGRGDGDKGRP